jgi:methionine-rich copper-binding protein CopC
MHLGQMFSCSYNYFMVFNKTLDLISFQGLKDIIYNLQGRISDLMNQNEDLFTEAEKLKKRNEELENQIRILKGEKPVPKFEKKKISNDKNNESKNKNTKEKNPRRKKEDLEIDKNIDLKVDRSKLPPNAIHKGYRQITIQEILFERHNICFNIERFLDPATGKMIEADIPAEYKGHEFGPTLRSFIVAQYFESDSTHSKIKNQLAGIDIDISKSQINNILLNSSLEFKDELEELREVALKKEDYQQIDDTSWKILKEKLCYTIVTGNKYFTQFATVGGKSRFAAIYALSGKKKPVYRLNDLAIEYAIGPNLSLELMRFLKSKVSEKIYTEDDLKLFFEHEELKKLSSHRLRDIRIGMYLAAFRAGDLGETGSALMSDDAGQFDYIYDDHALCWVHELRHYKLIEVLYNENKLKVEKFINSAWTLYRIIKLAQKNLTEKRSKLVLKIFNKLFDDDNQTGFKALDKQRKLTFLKADKLLAPLWNKKLPLHNNASELDVRGKVIKRKISLFNKSKKGAKAWDIFLGLSESCRKLKVNFYQKVLKTFKKIPQPTLGFMVHST